MWCAIHMSASTVNHVSSSCSLWLVTSRRRIQRVGTVSDSQNLITHLKAVSSTLAVPAGMPMSRVAPAATISSWRRS